MRYAIFTFAVLVTLSSATVSSAKPAHKQALANWGGPFLLKKLDDCRACHVPQEPGKSDESERPHNSFGKRLAELRAELKDAGKKNDIAACLELIANEDSDGDGTSNLIEILTSHYPGEATDKPTGQEVEHAAARVVAFRKYQSGYPWRPFESVSRPSVPAVDSNWARNPIDHFVAAGHRENGLTPQPEAPKATLLRRLYLDLTGLSPTPEQQRAFLQDTSTDAYEKVVEQLLASPQYGERWGRHWMDVWRYSDWSGYGAQVRDSKPHIWRWRDWIVESLNADKGYDRMVQEMLAGDELAPNDADTLRATGFLVRNYKLLSRERWMQDTVEHTFLAFQGVTINCARCHDHMFDPIEQKEYYQVRAIFEPHNVRTDRVPGEPNIDKDGLPRVYDAELAAPTYFFIRGDDRTPDKANPIVPGVPTALGRKLPTVQSVALPKTAVVPDRRDFVIAETMAASAKSVQDAKAKLNAIVENERAQSVTCYSHFEVMLRQAIRLKLSRDRAAAEFDAALAEATHVSLLAVLEAERLEDAGCINTLIWNFAAAVAQWTQREQALAKARKDHLAATTGAVQPKQKETPEQRKAAAEKALAQAEANAKAALTTAYTKRTLPSFPATSTGRRLALAKWLTTPENPLTARVAVNHIWLRHFGRAIVPSVFDFGRNGRIPAHPALLDYLACELMEHGWSMKHIHRLIVTSSTYRQASTPDSGNLARDPDNVYLWRMNPHRLEAEAVRDLVFHVAGRLDGRMGGADIDQNLGLSVPRRSIYFRHAAEKQMEFLRLFDAASVNECYQRGESIMPQQALALANSNVAIQNARILARKLAEKAGPDANQFVRLAFEAVLCRPPTDAESAECTSFLRQQTELASKSAAGTADNDGKTPSGVPGIRARENLVHVLLNHHEFVTVR